MARARPSWIRGSSTRRSNCSNRAWRSAIRAATLCQQGAAINLMGDVYQGRGQYDKAEEFYKKALDVAGSAGKTLVRRARATQALGRSRQVEGQSRSGLGKIPRGARTRGKLRRHSRHRMDALQGTGRAELVAWAIRQGCRTFPEGAGGLKQNGNVRDQAKAHGQLGKMYQSSGRNSQAIEHLRQGIQQAELTGNFKQVTEDLYALGLLHLSRGQYNKATEAFLQGLEKAKENQERET